MTPDQIGALFKRIRSMAVCGCRFTSGPKGDVAEICDPCSKKAREALKEKP